MHVPSDIADSHSFSVEFIFHLTEGQPQMAGLQNE